MHLLSVNVAQPRAHDVAGKPRSTGIFKAPVFGAVRASRLGLEGDFVGDTKHHGGPDQALYLYSAGDYDWWAEELGEVMEPGTFGENLTLSTFGDSEVRIGDRYRIGNVLLEITAPRIPCGTLAARMSDLQFVKKFREARRPGCYVRVLEEGELRAGDAVERLPTSDDAPTVLDLFEIFYEKVTPPEKLRWALTAPVAQRVRAEYARQLGERA